jgi:hypothetical protein
MFLVGPLIYLIFLICFILCAFLGYYIGKNKSSYLWGWSAFLISFGVIFGNEVYVNLQWNNLCNDGGVRVYKTDNVNGFLYAHDGVFFKNNAALFLRRGYKYIEAKEFAGSWEDYVRSGYSTKRYLYRFSLDDKGDVVRVAIEFPKSKYVAEIGKKYILSPYIRERRYIVSNLKTGEIMGTSSYFDTRGGWLMNWLLDTLLSDKVGTGRTCPEGTRLGGSVLQILPPISSENKE